MKIKTVLTIASVGFVAGCSMDPSRVEEDFGKSVRQMVAAQIADPEAASNPDLDGPDLLDGVAGEYSVDAYRDRAKGESADSNNSGITISVPKL